MGLAKFFKNGLSSAENLGNEAYAAPEILLGHVRDKRSDVWAMGKIAAELCIRVRLPTRAVTPIKVKESLKDSPYSNVLSRMVVTSEAERATMAGVIFEIRQIGANQGANQCSAAGRQHPGLGALLCGPRTKAADLGAKQKWRPPTPFPAEVKRHEVPVEHLPRGPAPQPHDLVPLNTKALANELSQIAIPCTLPDDGIVVHRRFDGDSGQMEIKQIVTRNGKVVKYEDVKIIK